MQLLKHHNISELLTTISKIKKNLTEWSLLHVSLAEKSSLNIFSVSHMLWEHFKETEGQILVCNTSEILVLMNTGRKIEPKQIEEDIAGLFPDKSCQVQASKVSPDGLQRFELRLGALQKKSSADSLMLAERQDRKENVILIADDDMFMRSLIIKAIESYGYIAALESGDKVVETYMKINPDAVFLDIHMPGKSGIEILNDILTFDPAAFIVMLSADSIKDNVLHTIKLGAKGFVAKPFTKIKLDEALNQCQTLTR